MVVSKKSNRWVIGIAAAVAAIVLAGIVWGPALSFRLTCNSFRDQHREKQELQAQELVPLLQQSTRASIHFLYQDLMTAAGKRDAAERQYKQFAADGPENAAMQAYYSRIVNDSETRKSSLAKAVELDPADDGVLLVQIENHLEAGKTAPAAALLDGLDENQWLRWQMEARIAGRLGELERAKEMYRKALDDGAVPISVAIEFARFATSWTDLTQGPIPNPFAKWLTEDIDSEPLAFAYLAWLSQKSLLEAVENLGDNVYYNPEALAILCRPVLLKYSKYHLALPAEKIALEPIDESVITKCRSLLKQAERIGRYNPEVLISLGLFALSKDKVNREDVQTANGLYMSGINGTPSFSNRNFHVRMGDGLAAIGKYDLAASHYLKAWNDLPEHGGMLKNLASECVEKKDYAKAIHILDKAKQFLPGDTEIHHARADIYLKQGELDKARKAFGNVIQYDEQDKYARDMIADIWMKKGNPARAIQVYKALLNRDPKNGHCYAQIALILLKSGELAKAERFLTESQQEHSGLRDMDDVLRAVNEINLAKK